MKHFTLALTLSLLFLVACQLKNKDQFYFPAEYSPQKSVWMGWENYPPYQQAYLDIVKALSTEIPLQILIKDSTELLHLQQEFKKQNINDQQITFHFLADNRLWIRDHGPSFLMNDSGKKKVIDFGWTLYGFKAYLKHLHGSEQDSIDFWYQKALGETGKIDFKIGQKLQLPIHQAKINMEAGGFECNGTGSLILCEQLCFQRNPDKSKIEIEVEMKKALGAKHIIWLPKGLIEDPHLFNHLHEDYWGCGTFGHTDEFVRFANDTTLLLAWVNEEEKNDNYFNQENYKRLQQNYQILQEARNVKGEAFHIIKVPLPDLLSIKVPLSKQKNQSANREEWTIPYKWIPSSSKLNVGDSLYWVAAASYLNFFVSNSVVLLPSYANKKKEKKVEEIFSSLYPQKKLCFIDVSHLNFHGGGIHCVTLQEPLFQKQ